MMWVFSTSGFSLAHVVFVILLSAAIFQEVSATAVQRDSGNAGADSDSPIDMKALYRQARQDVLDILEGEDGECENWRALSGQRCTNTADCGKGWLFRQKQLLLAITGLSTGEGGSEWHAGDERTVAVVGLKEGATGEEAECNASDLSMLLRLQGEEALAETAIPVEGRCAWTVKFRPLLEGVYTFDATLINWKGGLETDPETKSRFVTQIRGHIVGAPPAFPLRCNETTGAYGEGAVKMAAVPSWGGPFYGAFDGCCSLCTRMEGCVAWSATDKPSVALVNGDRCAMYSSVVGKPIANETLGQRIRSGSARGEEAMTFLGPAMSMGRSWCSERNGQLLGSGSRVVVAPERQSDSTNDPVARGGPMAHVTAGDEMPLCRSNLLHEGRWVSLKHDHVDCEAARGVYESDGWPTYNRRRFGTTVPEACFLRPADRAANASSHSTFSAAGGYVWKPYECRYDMMDSDSRITCLRDMNVTRFLDYGDSLITTSRIPRTALWLPNAPEVWSNGRQVPQAAEGAKAAGCYGKGASYYGEDQQSDLITRYCGVAAYWQVDVGQIRALVQQFSPDVILANWAIVHRLWHHSDEVFQDFLHELGKELDAMTDTDGNRPRHMFWLSAPFLVSEREPHCVLERAMHFNMHFREMLEPRGWIEVDWLSLTQKWSLDIPDGMHHGPPPTRMLAYMLLHQVCHGNEPP